MSGINAISTEATELLREREEQVRGLFSELQKSRRELSAAIDRSDYQSSRIEMLEKEVKDLQSTITSLKSSQKKSNKNSKMKSA